ncbi:MAG TPA: hypothetical protein VE994_09970, partial [Terriglobales bacterium]|nr:hypothetical protein [Terriglobales bacterium]
MIAVFAILLAPLAFVCLSPHQRAAAALKKHKPVMANNNSGCPAGTEDMLNWFTMSADLRQD